ncbi:MAG TPA: tripartite tricarboxylate transporter substrate binding protein [Burkholderiales bacterium]|nr:tripartite tricarboxylate transporter substrate binding protein [Burkholderiales bacterium]
MKAWARIGRVVLALLAAAVQAAVAQPYPNKPVRMVVPYAPGGVADIIARLLAERLSQNLGQPVVVLNKDGAGTIIGTDYAAKSTADGYTLLLTSTAIVMNSSAGRKLPYDLQRDLTPLTIFYVQPNVLVVHPSTKAASVKDLIAYAKANPRKLRYGSSGVGAVIHLYTELFASTAGIALTHVPYKGVAPAMVDLVAGQIDMMFSGILNAVPNVSAGRLRALGITTRERSSMLPDVAPIAEQGLPGFDVRTWYGLYVPARTPRTIMERLHGDVAKIAATPDFRERLASHGGEAVAIGPDAFKAQADRELQIWTRTIQTANIRIE